MRKKTLLPFVIFAAMIVAVAALVATKPKPAPAPPSEERSLVSLPVLPAKPEILNLSVTTQGTVEPKREINLISQVSGQIVAVNDNFVEGGFFDQGQWLVQIDDRDYQAAVLAAKSQVAAAEPRLAGGEGLALQAKREWRDLGSQRANELFMRQPQLAAAKANLESTEAALAMAELNLERTRITVPFAGRVRSLDADLGQFVTTGAMLASVYDSSGVEIRLPLTEAQAALIDLPLVPQTQAMSAASSVIIRASVAGEEHEWQGALTRTDAFVDAQSRMYTAVVEVADPFNVTDSHHQAPLLPGLFVEAEILGKTLEGVIALPRSALFERDKLMVLDAENKTRLTRVEVLRRTDEAVWVRANLAEKALIATEKQSLIAEGTIVEPSLLEPSLLMAAKTGGDAQLETAATDIEQE